MNTIFGWSRNGVILLLLAAAIVVVAFAGLLLLVAGAAGALAVGGVGPVSGAVLLLAIVALLAVNFILLVILVRCCCRSDRKQPQELSTLLPLLFPMVAQLPNALRDIAISLKKTSDAVGWIQENIGGAGAVLDAAGDVADTFTIGVPRVVAHREQTGTNPVDNSPIYAWIFDGVDADTEFPLRGLKTHLDTAGQDLAARTELGGDLDRVKTVLEHTASVVGLMANGLGASPPAPPEVTQP